MTGFFFIEQEGGEYRRYSFDGDPVPGTADGQGAYMVSSRDFSLKFIDVPRPRSRYVGEVLRYTVRSLYPGVPDTTVIDYKLLQNGRTRYAAVFVGQEETLSGYRKAANGGPLFHAFSIIERVAARQRKRSCIFLYLHCRWIEAVVYEEGVFSLSCTVGRTKDPADDLVRINTLLPERLSRARRVFLYHEKERAELRPVLGEYAAKGGFETAGEAVEPHLSHLHRGRAWIFSREASKKSALRRVSLQVLISIELLLVCVLLHREISRQTVLLDELYLFQEETAVRAAYIRELSDEIGKEEEALQGMRDRRPADLFYLLSEFASLVEGAAVLTELVFEKSTLRVSGLSPNALALLSRFSESDLFSDYEIVRVVSDRQTGKERFTLHATVSSRYRGEE